MKHDITIKFILTGFGTLFALYRWNTYPLSIRLQIAPIINFDPFGWWMMIIGVITIGIAIGSDIKEWSL